MAAEATGGASAAESSGSHAVIIDGFAAGLADGGLAWFCDPKGWTPVDGRREGMGGDWKVDDEGQLVVSPPAKKDFWRKTYYTPILCKDDGSCLFATIPADETVMVETTFTLDPKKQFDQAGLCIRLDNEHWKTGRGCDGSRGSRALSATATLTGRPSRIRACRIRVHKIGSSLVVEAGQKGCSDSSLAFIRIAHLSPSQGMRDDPLAGGSCTRRSRSCRFQWMGVFAFEDQDGCGVSRFFNPSTTLSTTLTAITKRLPAAQGCENVALATYDDDISEGLLK